VTSRPGAGSTFWFSICVTPGAETGLRQGVPDHTGLGGTTALVADGNATFRRVVSSMLGNFGIDPVLVSSGPAAVAALRTARDSGLPFTVALVEQSMDGMDLPGVRAAIAAVAQGHTHLIALTPPATQTGVPKAASEAAGIVLPKPVRPENLMACLQVVLGLDSPPLPPADSSPPTDWSEAEREVGLLLLAEDNLVNQKVAVAMLTSAGYRVDTVLDGAAAVRAAGDRRYDAILMDCQMPEMSGFEATAAIRAQEGSDRYTPIIALTAGARDEDRDRCLAEGMDAYMAKPFNKYALVGLVRKAIIDRPQVPSVGGAM
jgi:two-component system sensor histidine kinase/response regulator